MPQIQFRLPDIGEGIAEAEIVAWHVAVGDEVSEDMPLADVMTDKATVVIESPYSGTIIKRGAEAGDMLAIGATLVVIDVADGAAEDAAEVKDAGKAQDTPSETASPAPAQAATVPTEAAAKPSEEPSQVGRATKAPIMASPAVRARAHDLGINLADIQPSQNKRIRHADLDAYLSYHGAWRAAGGKRDDEQIKVIGMRRRIAENMAASKRNIPHFTYVEECDVTTLEQTRAQLNNAHGDRPKLTMLPLLIRAICQTLPAFPMLNARYDDEAGIVTRHGAVHLGMATQTDAGLMVPVIRDAQDRNLWQLAHEIRRLAEAARNGTATSEELSGSTITITSLGALGGVATTPVINRPEVAIIGPNRIVERPMFVPDDMGGERIAKRKLMNISISCDHRVVDGWDAASYIQALKRLIETPVLLFESE